MAQLVAGKALLGVSEQVLVGEIGAEEGRVVGVERDQQAGIEVPARAGGRRRRCRRRCGRWRWGSARGGCAALFKLFDQVRVLNGREGVADALGADGERLPDGLGAGGFAGVVGEAQAGLRGLGIEGAEGLGAGAALVAAEADADDGGVVRAHFGGLAEDALGLFDGEVAHGVEDPVEREAQFALGALAGALQAGEDGLEGTRGRSCATCR